MWTGAAAWRRVGVRRSPGEVLAARDIPEEVRWWREFLRDITVGRQTLLYIPAELFDVGGGRSMAAGGGQKIFGRGSAARGYTR